MVADGRRRLAETPDGPAPSPSAGSDRLELDEELRLIIVGEVIELGKSSREGPCD